MKPNTELAELQQQILEQQKLLQAVASLAEPLDGQEVPFYRGRLYECILDAATLQAIQRAAQPATLPTVEPEAESQECPF